MNRKTSVVLRKHRNALLADAGTVTPPRRFKYPATLGDHRLRATVKHTGGGAPRGRPVARRPDDRRVFAAARRELERTRGARRQTTPPAKRSFVDRLFRRRKT